MVEGTFVTDPRRVPRIALRCRADVMAGPRRWRAETLDVGPGGCQLVSPQALGVGAQVGLVVVPTAVGEILNVVGRVAWASALPPIRLGVAFHPTGTKAASWLDMVVRAQPHLARALQRVPDRISLDAMLYRGQPPADIVDFTSSELMVLRHIGDGVKARQLRERLDSSWNASRAALFALMARRHVTLSASEAVPASRWRALLLDAELVAAVNQISPGARPSGEAVTPRPSGPGRPPKAQHHLERALDDIASGRIPDAIAHMRIAASMSPRDELIRQVLDRIAPRA